MRDYIVSEHFGSNITKNCFSIKVAEKIASYHIIIEPVTAEQLFNSGGVVTEGGTVPVERSVSGGFLGVGSKGSVSDICCDCSLVTPHFDILHLFPLPCRGWRSHAEWSQGCEISGICRCD